MNTMIKCLPKEVQGKLRSGVALPSLQQCVEELILNSIDAEATCVGVRMDMEAFKVQVIDNGAGINSENMDSLGNRYCTSKCSSVEDLDSLKWYGFRGEALASIVSLSTLVEISSRTRATVKTHVKIFKDGKSMDVFEGETARPAAGTTVVVCNFLHNMPVRRKRMDAVLEGERIRHRVEAISLTHPSVSFTLKNDCTGAMMVQLPKARNTYHRFVQIHSLGRAQKLGEISYTHGQFEVIGYIGREGHYSNSLQFLYVNERLLLKTRIHKLLNFLLRRLSNSNQKNDSPDMQSAVRSPKTKRSQDPHGVYVINMKCSYSEYDICLEPAKTLIEFKDWDGVLLCIEEAVKAFLRRENLVAVLSQDVFDKAPAELCGTRITVEEGHNTGNVGQATSSASILDCSIGMKLASDSVHRKRQDDCVCEEDVSRESGQVEGKEETEQQRKEKITAKQLESEESINKDVRCEPSCDLARLNPTSDIKNNVEEESSEAGEGSDVFCKPSSVVQLEGEKLELSKENDMLINNTDSNGNETLLDCFAQQIQPDMNYIEQILPDCPGTGGHHHTLVSDRKISLSDPYIHENLLTQDMSQMNKSVFQQTSVQICEERCVALKRRISLEARQDRTGQKQDFTHIIPSKIPRISTSQKLSLCKESGSLERFRRVYGKSDELKLPSQDNTNRCSQPDGFVMHSQNNLLCQKDQQHGGVAKVEKEKEKTNSPLTLSAFTKLKPASVQNRGKTSLASKLFQLKHHSKVLPQDKCLSTGNDDPQEGNNNEHHCDTALNPEALPVCSTHPLAAEGEEASGDWLHHYEASVGKTVYVNKVTGLSRYDDLPPEETTVRCTSDVTNMAVSVINKMGMEYRCYPFQMELVLPFLPKSRTERVLSSGLDDRDANVESSNSLTTLYSKWKNPVFVRPPTVGVDVTSGQAVGLAVKIHNILFPYRFSKAMIHSMKVIHQVDKKFLACLINTREEEPAAMTETEGNLLVLVDQHAAHERVRLENLVADSYEEDPDAPGQKRLCSSTILPPLEITVTEEELRLLRSCQGHLRSLGLEVKFSQAAVFVFVGKVPLCFMEKESNELRRGRPSVIKTIVEEYLREQIELLRSTGTVRGTLPLTVLKVLASLACHGAIKFNDSLSRDECHSLVASLSSCQLPFQCAHGRPSIAPLVDTLHLDKDEQELQKPNLQKLRRMYKAWQLYGNR
ncbi:DNA mismatch repair protein Mlh3 isoform X1 [Pseudochaenichthys georgianus]|uniref:DNA mismatch repair protein Mlh3 isoform X1 n=1 Tax=Pseudochaenichthys georgianus TaxID=52239 RepID=UPI001469FF2E|nr:DNA mismatch repair protein Mlh3 isoform X1 [Pseudochaenichthys georgianus]